MKIGIPKTLDLMHKASYLSCKRDAFVQNYLMRIG